MIKSFLTSSIYAKALSVSSSGLGSGKNRKVPSKWIFTYKEKRDTGRWDRQKRMGHGVLLKIKSEGQRKMRTEGEESGQRAKGSESKEARKIDKEKRKHLPVGTRTQ